MNQQLIALEASGLLEPTLAKLWSRWKVSNLRHADYRSAALPTELQRRLIPRDSKEVEASTPCGSWKHTASPIQLGIVSSRGCPAHYGVTSGSRTHQTTASQAAATSPELPSSHSVSPQLCLNAVLALAQNLAPQTTFNRCGRARIDR